jgi:uncharacterized protein YhfF
VAAVLAGRKTATSSLLAEWEYEREPLPAVGERQIVVDSDRRPVATIELIAVDVVRLADVDMRLAREEGEGYESVSDWREAHESYWAEQVIPLLERGARRAIDDDTIVVLERFRVVSVPTE